MSATVVEAERRLPFSARDLCVLVGDVKSYPGFIPWIQSLRIVQETREGDGWRGLAQAIVGWRGLRERFSTYVTCKPDDGVVDVKLADGPFRHLENRWRFTDDGAGGAIVRFWISYEFRNPLLNGLARVNRETAADKIIAAFEREATRRFAAHETKAE
ncbi:MAG: type II toxin-antitoxin system RatA family toxin [Alphaproteobacteria bacterium]|nr:type II toxin-antitoxin system RatA family toxin [Alphaproteobacteria bacterium]